MFKEINHVSCIIFVDRIYSSTSPHDADLCTIFHSILYYHLVGGALVSIVFLQVLRKV